MTIRKNLLFAFVSGALIAACGGSTPPTAVPTPTPVPTPAPTPGPVIDAGCNLPALPDLHNECPDLGDGVFWGSVDSAIKATFKQHPELFDFNDTKGGGLYSFKVLDRRKYTGAVVDNLHAVGLCAVDELEEIAVKNSQEFNEQYNIWTSDSYVRSGPGAYITTCYPAQF